MKLIGGLEVIRGFALDRLLDLYKSEEQCISHSAVVPFEVFLTILCYVFKTTVYLPLTSKGSECGHRQKRGE